MQIVLLTSPGDVNGDGGCLDNDCVNAQSVHARADDCVVHLSGQADHVCADDVHRGHDYASE